MSYVKRQPSKTPTESHTLKKEKQHPNIMETNNHQFISIKDKKPDSKEPIVYALPRGDGKWGVGIAYWTKSDKWNPEAESQHAPEGFTHWMPLPPPPSK